MQKLSVFQAMVVCGTAALFTSLVVPEPVHQGQANNRFHRIATALEAYAVDNNGKYPPDKVPGSSEGYLLHTLLTTPVPYLSPEDLFDPLSSYANTTKRVRYVNFAYTYGESTSAFLQDQYRQHYALHGSWLIWSGRIETRNPATGLNFDPIPYDPTNGTVSLGTIYRSQRHLSETALKPIEQ